MPRRRDEILISDEGAARPRRPARLRRCGRARGQGLRRAGAGRGACAACSRERPATARRSSAGRARCGQFTAALAACRETGRGQAVYVRGEAGIGKTRLVEEFLREAAAAGFACHVGLVLDFGAGTGRDAVRALVRGLLGLRTTSERRPVGAAAEQGGGRWPGGGREPCSSTTCSTCRSRRSCARSTTPWTTRRATGQARTVAAAGRGGRAGAGRGW